MHPDSHIIDFTNINNSRFNISGILKLCSAISLCLLLSNCSNNSGRILPPAEVLEVPVGTPNVVNNNAGGAHDNDDLATPLNTQSNYNLERAEYYEQLADSQNDNTIQINSTLSAAEYYVQGNDYQQAQQSIASLNPNNLDQQQTNRYNIIQAYIDYSAGNYEFALQQLEHLIKIETPAPFATDDAHQGKLDRGSEKTFIEDQTQRVDALLLSSFCYQQLNNFEAAISKLLLRESLLVGNARSETTRYTWQVINQLNSSDRQRIIGQTQNVALRNRLEQSLNGNNNIRPS